MIKVNCKIYPFDVWVHFGELEEMFKEMKGKIDLDELEDLKAMDFNFNLGKCVHFYSGASIIWMPKKPKTTTQVATLVHEIFHCSAFILNRVGVRYSHKSDEAYAYLIEYLTKTILKKAGIKIK